MPATFVFPASRQGHGPGSPQFIGIKRFHCEIRYLLRPRRDQGPRTRTRTTSDSPRGSAVAPSLMKIEGRLLKEQPGNVCNVNFETERAKF